MKRWIWIIAGIIVVVGLIHLGSALTWDKQIEYKEITFTSPKIPKELDGYVVAFVTDTHQLPGDHLQEVVKNISQRQVDLLLLGGDFPNGDAVYRSMEILGKVETVDGIYGVEGNHDDYKELFDAMKKNGMHPLNNEGVEIHGGFYLAGVEDLWNRSPDVQTAIYKARPEEMVLLLCHNPDVVMKQNVRGVDLMLSGHTHGGQLTFFGVLAPALAWTKDITDYGQKFQSGWVDGPDGVKVFVSNGTGQIKVPRVFARPQVIYLTLRSGK